MTDDMVNTVLFYFFCGTLDVFFTILVLFTNTGIEANPLWNWIAPKELMLIVCVVANLAACLVAIYLIPRIPQHMTVYRTIIKFGIIGEGLGRVAFGAIPGILILKGAGLI